MGKQPKLNLDSCSQVRLLGLLDLASKPQSSSTGTRLRGSGEGSMVEVLKQFEKKTGWAATEFINKVTRSEVPIEKLREQAEKAHDFAAEAADAEEWFAASFVYHVALAAAFVRYQTNLASRSMGSRTESYEDFATRLGEHPLGGLFRQAADLAREEVS